MDTMCLGYFSPDRLHDRMVDIKHLPPRAAIQGGKENLKENLSMAWILTNISLTRTGGL